MIKLNNREVVDIEIEGIDRKDYPDFTDAFISHAVWKDTGQPLSESELVDLSDEHPDLTHELAYEAVF